MYNTLGLLVWALCWYVTCSLFVYVLISHWVCLKSLINGAIECSNDMLSAFHSSWWPLQTLSLCSHHIYVPSPTLAACVTCRQRLDSLCSALQQRLAVYYAVCCDGGQRGGLIIVVLPPTICAQAYAYDCVRWRWSGFDSHELVSYTVCDRVFHHHCFYWRDTESDSSLFTLGCLCPCLSVSLAAGWRIVSRVCYCANQPCCLLLCILPFLFCYVMATLLSVAT